MSRQKFAPKQRDRVYFSLIILILTGLCYYESEVKTDTNKPTSISKNPVDTIQKFSSNPPAYLPGSMQKKSES